MIIEVEAIPAKISVIQNPKIPVIQSHEGNCRDSITAFRIIASAVNIILVAKAMDLAALQRIDAPYCQPIEVW